MQRILIDTEPGVDDALAILLAMKCPELQIEAITTVCGNVSVEQATQNVLTILGLLDLQEFPMIAKGEAAPLVKSPLTAAHVHGADGLGNISQLQNADRSPRYPAANTEISSISGVDMIIELAAQYPGELTLVALGPLTNVAKAAQKAPAQIRGLREIVLMGGAFEAYGNVTTTAEFNIFVDADAAQAVFDCGVPIRMAPLDATSQVALTRERLHAETEGHHDAVSCFVREATQVCMEFYRQHIGFAGLYPHDLLPIGMLTRPAYFQYIASYVQIETAGTLTNGMTVADLREGYHPQSANARVCVKVEAEEFLHYFFQRLFRTD